MRCLAAPPINSTYRHALRAYVAWEQHAALLLSNYGSVRRRRLGGAHRRSGDHRAGTGGPTAAFLLLFGNILCDCAKPQKIIPRRDSFDTLRGFNADVPAVTHVEFWYYFYRINLTRMASVDGFISASAERPVGYKQTRSMTRGERCPLLLMPASFVGQARLLIIFTRVQVWPVSRKTKWQTCFLEICRTEELIFYFGSDARQMSSSLDNDSKHLLIQEGMCA